MTKQIPVSAHTRASPRKPAAFIAMTEQLSNEVSEFVASQCCAELERVFAEDPEFRRMLETY